MRVFILILAIVAASAKMASATVPNGIYCGGEPGTCRDLYNQGSFSEEVGHAGNMTH